MPTSTALRRSIVAACVATAGVVAFAVPVQAAPPTTPVFDAAIDAYAASVPQTTCDTTPKPGVIGFREMVLRTYPTTRDSGIGRDCAAEGDSEHKEGRAWDWGVNANNAADRARADEFLSWLLATDRHGNKHANARRLGVMYVIWNGRIWGSYRAAEGWRTYTGASPHTDHVHVSFSWAGARKQTTWWTKADQPASWPRVERGSRGVDVVTLQHLLNATGETLTVDGNFGSGTEAAVRQFQSANGATADGIVGMMTWSKLIRQVQRGATGEEVKAVQAQLNALGHTLTVDGRFGPATETAVKDYQGKRRMPTDGIVSPTIWQLLIAGVGVDTASASGAADGTVTTRTGELYHPSELN